MDNPKNVFRDFASRVGLAIESPMEAFELFYSEDLQKMILDESNRYARHVMGDEKYKDRTKITVEEMIVTSFNSSGQAVGSFTG